MAAIHPKVVGIRCIKDIFGKRGCAKLFVLIVLAHDYTNNYNISSNPTFNNSTGQRVLEIYLGIQFQLRF